MTRTSKSKVLLTRPSGDNEALADCLTEQGYAVRELPLFDIQLLPETPEQRATLMNIDLFHGVVSTSKHASRALIERLDEFWPQLPVGVKWYAMGSGSAEPLTASGLEIRLPLQGNTSEDLLAREDLQELKQSKFLLAKGIGGRDLIAGTLSDRGAQVDTLELYQRVPVEYSETELQDCLQLWQPDQIVVLSTEALQRLWSLSAKIGYSLQSTTLVVPSARVAEAALNYQLSAKVVPTLQDEDVLRTLQQS